MIGANVELPYLTSPLPGIGGRIKEDVSDFQVREVPLYMPCGEGTHVYFQVTKRGVPTPAAVERIARHMGVFPPDIGVAGLKDAQALTTQLMSLEHADPEQLRLFRNDQVQIEVIGRHGNKLRPGHLKGNRFVIRVRGIRPGSMPLAQQILDVLERRGVPNFFGEQRFGARADTAILGELLVRNDLDQFIAHFLGHSQAGDPVDCKAARDAFDTGFFQRALDRWPRHYGNERRALSAYKKKKHAGPAVAAIDKRMKRLYVSAFQSRIFNEVLSARLGSLDQVFYGDLAIKSPSGGVFLVLDPRVEQPRAEQFEISPSGPIIGFKGHLAGGEGYEDQMAHRSSVHDEVAGEAPAADESQEDQHDAELASGTEQPESTQETPAADTGSAAGLHPADLPPQRVNPGKMEREVLARHGVHAEDFRHVGTLKVKGTRRPLRFRLEEVALSEGKDERGDFLEISFLAPSGCYATVVLGEIMKNSPIPQ